MEPDSSEQSLIVDAEALVDGAAISPRHPPKEVVIQQ